MNLISTNIFIIRISLFIGFFFLFSSLFLFIIIIANRIRLVKKKRDEEAFIKKWRPIILENLYRLPETVEKFPAKYNTAFLILWNNLQDILRGPEKEQLNQLAKALEMDQVARKMLSSRKMVQQLLGVLVIGNLKDQTSFSVLKDITEKENMTLAMAALHSLAKINPEKTVQPLLNFMKDKEDWPDYKVIAIFNEIGPSIYSVPLAEKIRRSRPVDQARLLKFMQNADRRVSIDLSKELLSSPNPEIQAAALNLLAIFGDSRDLALVKPFLTDEKSFVRMRAVTAMAAIGNVNVIPDLEKCLSDPDWWVRFRTAEAIASIPGMTKQHLLEMRERQSDRFAKDILTYITT